MRRHFQIYMLKETNYTYSYSAEICSGGFISQESQRWFDNGFGQATNHHRNRWWPRLMTHKCVTQRQWVNVYRGLSKMPDIMRTTFSNIFRLEKTSCSLSNVHVSLLLHINGLVQDCSNSSALAMELLQSCPKPSICKWQYLHQNWYRWWLDTEQMTSHCLN